MHTVFSHFTGNLPSQLEGLSANAIEVDSDSSENIKKTLKSMCALKSIDRDFILVGRTWN
jgi:predicted HTH transcriptional regulator